MTVATILTELESIALQKRVNFCDGNNSSILTMPSGESTGAIVGVVAALLLVVGVVASAVVLKKKGITRKDNPGVTQSGETCSPKTDENNYYGLYYM